MRPIKCRANDLHHVLNDLLKKAPVKNESLAESTPLGALFISVEKSSALHNSAVIVDCYLNLIL